MRQGACAYVAKVFYQDSIIEAHLRWTLGKILQTLYRNTNFSKSPRIFQRTWVWHASSRRKLDLNNLLGLHNRHFLHRGFGNVSKLNLDLFTKCTINLFKRKSFGLSNMSAKFLVVMVDYALTYLREEEPDNWKEKQVAGYEDDIEFPPNLL